jgi:hypothetical protein
MSYTCYVRRLVFLVESALPPRRAETEADRAGIDTQSSEFVAMSATILLYAHSFIGIEYLCTRLLQCHGELSKEVRFSAGMELEDMEHVYCSMYPYVWSKHVMSHKL